MSHLLWLVFKMPRRGLEAENRGDDIIGNLSSFLAIPLVNVKLAVQEFHSLRLNSFLFLPAGGVSVALGGQVSGVAFTL